jgi:hypothetical protein
MATLCGLPARISAAGKTNAFYTKTTPFLPNK